MTFDWLYHPAEWLDGGLAGGLTGAGLLTVLALAALLGLRHATDPDHLVAITALVSAEGADARDGVRLGVSWGVGHAAVLLLGGIPLIVLGSQVPPGLERGAETLIGIVIMVLAARVLIYWWRRRGVPLPESAAGAGRGVAARVPRRAAAIGVLHGLGGTGAIVLLFLTALPTTAQATAALCLFAATSVVSMALCTGAYAWLLMRPAPAVAFQRALMPALGVLGLLFGCWYAGLG